MVRSQKLELSLLLLMLLSPTKAFGNVIADDDTISRTTQMGIRWRQRRVLLLLLLLELIMFSLLLFLM